MAAAPVQPVPGGAGRWWVGEQAPGFWDGERDHAGVGGRWLVRPDRCWRLGAGAAAQQGGGDSADGQGGHDQHGVPGDRGVAADLGLVQAEAALAELEAFLRLASAARRRGSAGTATAAGPGARDSSERPARRSRGGGGSAGSGGRRWWRSRPTHTSAHLWIPSRRSGPPSGGRRPAAGRPLACRTASPRGPR